MSEWQPIEAAPKDGSRILVWGGFSVEIVAWDDVSNSSKKGWQIGVHGESGFNYYDSVAAPTHWMPLPDPPK